MSDTVKAVKSLRGTQTEKNIVISYLNESSAYTRYTFYAAAADKESLFPVGAIFRATALNELRHAKVFFKMLQGGSVGVQLDADAGVIGPTTTNLEIAMKEELAEGVDAYMAFAKTAREEGFDDIATHFEAIATIERRHHDRFARYLKMVEDNTLWKREKPVTWQCLVCGYTFVGTEPPMVCPACDHPYQHYMACDPEDDILQEA